MIDALRTRKRDLHIYKRDLQMHKRDLGQNGRSNRHSVCSPKRIAHIVSYTKETYQCTKKTLGRTVEVIDAVGAG